MAVTAAFPQVMGILNVTPDSFYDGGRYIDPSLAVERAHQMIQEGVDIIDIGGESTRPGAQAITPQEELARVIPIIKRLTQECTVPLSIDSRHYEVIQSALDNGVSIVNSITALSDEASLKLVAEHQVPVCLMHMQGTPQTMQQQPTYQDVLTEINHFFMERIERCESHGILRRNIWIDPGFGFGKSLAHNLTLLGKLSFFKNLQCPILVGLSRKSMFGMMLDVPVEQRLYGTLGATMIALLQGAAIIRTHDVAATKDVLKVFKATQPYYAYARDVVPS